MSTLRSGSVKRVVKWLLFNSLFFTALSAGYVYGVEGAQNAATFYVWLMFIVALSSHSPSSQLALAKLGAPVIPASTAILLDLAVAFFLAWNGVWLTASVWMLSCVLAHAAWKKALQPKAEVAA